MQVTIQNVEVMLLYDLHYSCQWRTFLNEKKVMKPSANTSHKTDDSMNLNNHFSFDALDFLVEVWNEVT